LFFAEADHLDVLKAAQIAYEEFVIYFIGKQRNHFRTKRRVGFYAELEIIDPKIKEEDARRNKFATIYWESRKRKGISLYDAQKLMREKTILLL
jgi:malate dehydrogenase (oxaloacetate-decarboxylating)(NADP+)